MKVGSFLLNDIMKDDPEFAKCLRDHPCKKAEYEQLNFVVITNPESNKGYLVYGLFYIDWKANKEGKEEIIVQDFVVKDLQTLKYTRYSGGPNKNIGKDQHIRNFCKKFGKDTAGVWRQYGCSENDKTSNHRYRKDSNELPKEERIREIISNNLNRIE